MIYEYLKELKADTLCQILQIIPREDRAITEILRNIDQKNSGLKKESHTRTFFGIFLLHVLIITISLKINFT